VARSKILDYEMIKECMKIEFGSKEKLIQMNLDAMEEGRKAAQ
jgi:2-oxoglutarate ferredoxin oxidoreductase subunit gamma